MVQFLDGIFYDNFYCIHTNCLELGDDENWQRVNTTVPNQKVREDSDGEATPTGQRSATDPMEDLMEAAKKLNMRVQLSPVPGERAEASARRDSTASRTQSRSSSGNRWQKARAPLAPPAQQLQQESRPQSRAGSGSRTEGEPGRVKERIGGPLMSPTRPKPGLQQEPTTSQEGNRVPEAAAKNPVQPRLRTGPMTSAQPKSGSRERATQSQPRSIVQQSHRAPVQEQPRAIVPKNPFGGVVVMAEDSTTEEEEEDDDGPAVRERQAPTQMWSRRRSYAASVQQG